VSLTTGRIERLAELLMAEKGYKRREPVLLLEPHVCFVGSRDLWWGGAPIALVDADDLDRTGIERVMDGFFAYVYRAKPTRFWTGSISYGTLCAVYREGAPPDMVESIRALKHVRGPNQTWAVAWTLDLKLGAVTPHRFWPWGMYPGRRYLEGAIRRV
jgi:hypothetical protein